MNKLAEWLGKVWIVLVLVWLAARPGAALGASARPEVSGTSITAEGATLVYGANFADKDLAVHVQEPPRRKKTDKPITMAELKASLGRVLSGKAQSPPAPKPKDRGWRRVEHADDAVMMCDTRGHASSYLSVVKVLRVRNAHGTSAPVVLNRPEIWGLSPRKPAPGEAVAVWGANIGTQFAFVDKGARVVAVAKAYRPYCTHSHRPEHKFYQMLIVPETLKPGTYRLYGWGGFGDLGWGEPADVQVIAAPKPPVRTADVTKLGATGNGATDDTQAIAAAIDKARKAGGGRVLLPAGRYVVSRTLVVPPGVRLVGHSREATVIEASRWTRFGGAIPAACFSRPPDYDPKTYKPRGWGVDWVMEKMYVDRPCMVWLQSDAAAENLTLEATHSSRITAVVLVADPAGGVCRKPVVRNCRLLCERVGLYGQWPDFRVAQGILLTSSTEDMVVERNHISVNGVGMNHMPGVTRYARIRYNTFTAADPHGAFELWMPRTTQHCLIEGNRFIDGGRAKTEQAHGFPYPVTRNCYVHNIFRNCNKGDGELLMYETGGVTWFGQVAGSDATHVRAAGAQWKPTARSAKPGSLDAGYMGSTAVIMKGRGLGQFRPIMSNTADTLTVATPWRVTPDTTSTLGILHAGVIENVHIGNEFFYCHYYCGVYGSGLRNVWVNEVYESVGGGLFLWPIAGARVMALNLVYGNKYHERAGIVMTNDRRPGYGGKPTAQQIKRHQSLQKCFGNEVRACSLRQRSYVSSENGQIWTRPLRYHWARHGRSSPISPVPGTEAAIAVWDTLRWAGGPDDPGLDKLPASTRWNLLAENHIVRCPVGIQIGKAVEKTILMSNSFYECPTPVRDLGRGTINLDSFIKYPSNWVRAKAPQPKATPGK